MLINLKVKTLDARTHEFSIDNDITIREFKDKIAEKTNISADNQRLIYQGRVLADDKQVKEYDVDGKVLHVAERPPFSQRDPRQPRNPRSNDDPRVSRNQRGGAGNANMRNSPFFRALDGMLVGTMTIPVNAPGPQAPANNSGGSTFASSSSFCMNRITVARHMINCANNIAAYLENPDVGLNNPSLDILERGRWTMESTVVEVGVSAAELPRNQNLMDMVQGAVTAALSRNNPGRNYTVVQLPSVYANDDAALGRDGGARANANNASDTQSDPGVVELDDEPAAAAAVIIEDVIETDDGMLTGNGNASVISDAETQIAREGLAESIAAAAQNLLSTGNDNSNAISDAANGIAAAVGNQTEGGSNRRRTGTIVLADVMEQYQRTQTRLNPFLSQYREMLREEPSFEETETAARESAQRIFDRVSEALHYLSHAQHAISDLMLDLSQPAPRYLTCRPILVEQSGYIRSNNVISPNIMGAQLRPAAGSRQQTPTIRQSAATAASAATVAANAAEIAANAAESAANAAVSAAQASGIADAVAQSLARSAPAATTQTNGINGATNGQSDQTMDEQVDDPDVTPNVPPSARRTAGGAAGAQNSGSDAPVLRLSEPPRFRLYVPYNPQAQMARLLQAVVNSATNDAELRLQINAPSMVSINVPVITNGQTGAATANGDIGNTETSGANGSNGSANSNSDTSTATADSSGPTAAAAAAATGSNETQIGVSAITLPTTSTQTRSTSRPQIQIGANNNWNSRFMSNTAFDRFLPCNSHHIRESEQAHASNNNPTPVNGASGDEVNVQFGIGSTMTTNNSNATNNTGSNGASSGTGAGAGAGNNSRGGGADGVSNSNGGSGGIGVSGGSNGRGPVQNWTGPERRLLTFGNRHYHNTGTTHTTSTGTNTSRLSSLGNRNIDLTDLLANLTNRAAAAAGISRVNRSTQSTERVNATTMTDATRPITNRQDRSTSSSSSSSSSSTSMSTASTTTPPPPPPPPLNSDNLRTQLRNFLSRIVFEGASINDQTIPPAINRALSWFREILLFLPQYENTNYDSRGSVCNVFQSSLTLIIKLCSNEHESSAQFVEQLRQICEEFRTRLYSVLFVSIGRYNAQLYWGQLMRLLLAPLESNLRNEALQFLCVYLNPTNPASTDTAEAQQFLVLRSRSSSSRTGSTNGTDATTEVSDSQQASDGDVEMAEIASTSDSQAKVENVPATPAVGTDATLPSVVYGSETWHHAFANDWLPVIAQDIRTQNEQPINQPPYSEAYISGMSAKRRKIIQSTKPSTNVNSLIADSVRRAMQVNSVGASTTSSETISADAVTSSIAHDSAVQSSYTEAVRNNVRERLKKDPDFKQEKYPQTSKFVNNNK